MAPAAALATALTRLIALPLGRAAGRRRRATSLLLAFFGVGQFGVGFLLFMTGARLLPGRGDLADRDAGDGAGPAVGLARAQRAPAARPRWPAAPSSSPRSSAKPLVDLRHPRNSSQVSSQACVVSASDSTSMRSSLPWKRPGHRLGGQRPREQAEAVGDGAVLAEVRRVGEADDQARQELRARIVARRRPGRARPRAACRWATPRPAWRRASRRSPPRTGRRAPCRGGGAPRPRCRRGWCGCRPRCRPRRG